MDIPNAFGLGFRVRPKMGELQEISRITNMTYKTPYQIKYRGLLLETDKKSTAYDADATPTQCVAVPAAAGQYVDGFAYITSYLPHPLPGGADVLYPVTADIGDSGYAEDYNDWFPLTVAPLIPGYLISIPVSAGATIDQCAEITSDASGFATNAASSNWVVAKAEWPANNSTGAAGAEAVIARVCHQYKKA